MAPRLVAICFILNSPLNGPECKFLAEATPAHICFMLQMIAQYASLWAILKRTGERASRELIHHEQ
jgi:hypothetical protein